MVVVDCVGLAGVEFHGLQPAEGLDEDVPGPFQRQRRDARAGQQRFEPPNSESMSMPGSDARNAPSTAYSVSPVSSWW